MYAHIRRFNLILLPAVFLLAASCPALASSESSAAFKRGETSLYQDLVDQSVYYEGTSYLRFDRIYRKISGKKLQSLDVNRFDEVPDSGFFTNRHGRHKLSAAELEKGSGTTGGPDPAGNLEIFYAEGEETPPKFWVRDSKGDFYLLKFDPQDYLELATSAEVITNRFYHAIGYNVFQTTIAVFSPDKLKPAEGAVIFDASGFKKTITAEKLQELILFIPADSEGRLRAVAVKIPEGQAKGGWNFTGRASKDAKETAGRDSGVQARRRVVQALQVFASWLNHDDLRQSATLEPHSEKGSAFYLTDFDSALGAGSQGPKPPMLSHEHMIDFGETARAFFTLGFWEKPWQKRWREADEKIHSPAAGYFDNRYFDPGKFKTQLPYYAFKDVTRADGLWAAKIIMNFSDDDIRALVKSGQYTDANDEKYIADTLIERRNLIGEYWFKKANPLDEFDLHGNTLVFKDLAAQYGFVPEGKSAYRVDVLGKYGKKTRKIKSLEVPEPAVPVEQSWFQGNESTVLHIRTVRPGASRPGSSVLVELTPKGIISISHQD